MKWIKRLLGLNTPLEKKQKQLSVVLHSAMLAQRNGDLRTYADLTKEAEAIEDEILEMINENK